MESRTEDHRRHQHQAPRLGQGRRRFAIGHAWVVASVLVDGKKVCSVIITHVYDWREGGTEQTVLAESVDRVTNRRTRLLRLFLLVGVPLLVAIGGAVFWQTGGRYVSTENAYVKADIAQ